MNYILIQRSVITTNLIQPKPIMNTNAMMMDRMDRFFQAERMRFHSIEEQEGRGDLRFYQPCTDEYIKDELIDALDAKLEDEEEYLDMDDDDDDMMEDQEEERQIWYNDTEINCAKQFMEKNDISFALIRYYNYSNIYVYFMSHTIGRTEYDVVVCLKSNTLITVQIIHKITHVKSARGGVRK